MVSLKNLIPDSRCWVTAAVLGCASCGSGGECPAVVEPAIIVTIRDAETFRPLADEARGSIRDGAYLDSLRPYQPNVSRAAGDQREGTYAVEIRRSGYQEWTRAGVRVVRDGCFLRTQRITADLVTAAQ